MNNINGFAFRARLVIRGLSEMAQPERKAVATWLRKQAISIEGSDKYSKNYTARYWVRQGQ